MNWLELIPVFEVRVIATLTLLVLMLIINGVVLIRKLQISKRVIFYNVFSLLFAMGVIASTVLIRPYVVKTSPADKTQLTDAAPTLEIHFDNLVKVENIEFNMSPEIAGTWEWEEIFPGVTNSRKATFIPGESLYPGSEFIVYITGIRNPWIANKEHEHAVEFSAPAIPELKSLSIEEESEDVAINEELTLSFDAPLGDYVEIAVQTVPEVEVEVETLAKKLYLNFPQKLAQDQNYTFTVYQTPRSYSVETGEDVERGETMVTKEFSFKTVTTPFLKDYSPKGSGILATSNINIVFDQDMDRESVVKHLSLSPALEYVLNWESDSKLKLIHEGLSKDTDYVVTISSGVESAVGGNIDQDLSWKFKTIGPVKVTSFSPIGNSSGVSVETNVVIAFDQEVNKEDAQSKFSVSPSVSGSFSWEGNTMTFNPSVLGFSTGYTAKISSGVKTVNGEDSKESFSSYFVTRDNVFSLNIPWYKQAEGFTCNLAATRMVLAYNGIYRSESQIKSAVGIGTNPNADWVAGYGVHSGPIASYIRSQGVGATIKSGWNVSDLLREVEKGRPVMIWEYNRYSTPYGSFTLPGGATGYTGMHSEVVRGYIGTPNNPVYILTNDPWRGRLTYTLGTFKSVWSYLGNTAIIIN